MGTAPTSHPLPAGIVVHRPNVLRPVDVTTKQEVPITNPIRSLLDAGVELSRWQVGDCVERALVSRLVTVKGLRVILAELGGRGRTGTAALRTHLDRRALGERRPESMIEPLMARLLYATDGLDAHAGRDALDHDLARQNLLVRHGFLVLRYTTTHLRRPAAVTREIVDTCRQRIASLEQHAAA